MSTARVFNFDDYSDEFVSEPVTDPAGIEPIRPTEVLTRIGKHGAWERIAAPIQTHAGPVARAGAGAWWEIVKNAPAGVQFVGQRVGPVLADAEGRAEINAYTRKIRNRKAAAKDLEEGSDEQLKVINQEQKAREDRRAARIAHNIKVGGFNAPIVAAVGAGLHYWPDLPLAVDGLIATAATCGGVTALGLAGRRVKGGEALFRRARTRSINDELLREVLANLGIQALASKINEVKPVTLTVDNKTHFSTTLRLPMRVTATDVQTKHETFAANLDVNPDCLILERGESASRLVVKVSKVDPAKRKQGSWEMPKTVDIFGPLVVGENIIGDSITMTIPASLLAFGKTGWGKSVFLRLLVSTALLDPLVRFRLGAFKSGGNFSKFVDLAEQSVVGHASQDDVAHKGLLFLEGLNRECAQRNAILGELNEDDVTRALAEQYPELRPIFCVTDEIQLLFANKSVGGAAKNEMLKLLSNIRSTGVRLVTATQMFNQVIDTKFPGAFTNVVVFKTSNEWEGRSILGDTSESEGFKPYYFKQAGEAVINDGDGRRRTRVFNVSDKQQRASIERRRAMCGGAVEQVPLAAKFSARNLDVEADPQVELDCDRGLLRDIIAVATPTSEQIAADPLAEFVIQTDPLVELLRKSGKAYGELTTSELRQRLGAFGLKTHQKNLPEVNGKRPSRNGWWLSEINQVINNKGEQS